MRIITCSMIFLMSLAQGCSQPNSTPERKPNIVLLFVDDWGWMDLGYRNAKFNTPNIDQLKKDGVEFTRAYIPTPTCSPSRATMLTGKEAARLEMYRHITHEYPDGTNDKKYNYWENDPANRPSINWLPLEEETYAEKLKEFGYYNLFVGKWHLGHEPYHPIHQGFDEQFGTSNWGHPKSYYPPYFENSDVLKDVDEGQYLTDVLTNKTVNFIESYEKEDPFMVSFWYYNVHGPHYGRKDWLEKFLADGLTGDDAEYAAMVTAMDESVGRVRAAIEQKGIADNTIILLISDQGGLFTQAPLSGGKRGGNTLGEGGARVPFIVHYPGITTPGAEVSIPIQTIDVFPTLVEVASGKAYNNDQINGVSLMPALKGGELPNRNLYFFRSYEDQSSAIMNGDWKLVRYLSGRFELFNVTIDISEQNNIIDSEVVRAEKMKAQLARWEHEAVRSYD